MGKRTSVYLSDDLAAAVGETGLPLAELVRRGVCASLVVVPASADVQDVPQPDVVTADAPSHRRCEQCGWLQRGAVSHCEQCGAQVGRVLR